MRRHTVRTYTAAATALAALLLPVPAVAADTAQGAAAAVTEKVPYAMDSSNQAAWWTPVATYKGRGQYTYFAFNEPGSAAATHRPAIARRDPDGAWSLLPLVNRDGQRAEFADDNGHNQPSVARDGSGRLHVFASMHADAWRYYRTDAPGAAVTDRASELPDQGVGITYPIVTTAPNGDLYLAARVGSGADQRPGKLYRWNNAESRWSVVATFAGALYRSVYPDDITVDASGRVHLLYEWGKAPATAFRHQLSYLAYDPSTGAFADSTGAAVAAPVTPATSDVVQDFTAGEEWSNDNAYPGSRGAERQAHARRLHAEGRLPVPLGRQRRPLPRVLRLPERRRLDPQDRVRRRADQRRPRHHLGRDGHQEGLLRDRLGHRPGLRRDAVGGRRLDRGLGRAGRERGPARRATGLGRPRCPLSAGHRAQLPLLRIPLRRQAERLP
ncbi:BNR-4 repeat-containing protein [Streptomyces griseus]|uniref:BNR-4 repeat-containing protein n=2 Tax=Streptomyces griseus TaxID=1911 RepID=UPI00331A87BC